jgi:hypothetical protein
VAALCLQQLLNHMLYDTHALDLRNTRSHFRKIISQIKLTENRKLKEWYKIVGVDGPLKIEHFSLQFGQRDFLLIIINAFTSDAFC